MNNIRILVLVILLILSGSLHIIIAQSKLPTHSLQLNAGYSRHGSGDMKGTLFGLAIGKYYTKRLSLHFNLNSTINWGKDEIIVNNLITEQRTDASVRFTTAGVQLGVNGGLSMVRTRAFEFMLALGTFGRFQSASNGSDGYEFYSPGRTGQPTVLIGYNNKTPQNTFSLGGVFQFQLNYTMKNKIFLGLQPGFQTDTNGDAIPYASLVIGKSF